MAHACVIVARGSAESCSTCRALRYKHKPERAWAEVHSEWEIYRARLRSLECREPALKFSDDVRSQIGIDITGYRGAVYKQFDDLLDGILCAYLAYYYWCWGEEGSWVVGEMATGYVTLPRCRLKNCAIAAPASNLAISPGN